MPSERVGRIDGAGNLPPEVEARIKAIHEATAKIRTFETGATRNSDVEKPDYEGYLSPLAIQAFGRYMTRHRVQEDGSLRSSDNWQKGIPRDQYLKSAFRHFVAWWAMHRKSVDASFFGADDEEALEEALCGLLFNVQGYLHEALKIMRPGRWT